MSKLREEDICPNCMAWHGVWPLEHLIPGIPCNHNRDRMCILCKKPVGGLSTGGPTVCSLCDNDPEIVKRISKDMVEGLKALDNKGELARAGEKVAKAIIKLRKERKLTPKELNRRATI